ncbi:uncharacterized protein KQ657_003139 [Scheffersomyces spartinae]|uniref:Uncharacterized protein n=1 Tax=Scheffersomyces spartinae TaxID=45513 RepID=A0A9P7V500_9ASCO|nr:uncharacterized protein KQ657_003139 [Scheffersomyces spartinae]KAG7191463.1 hypothetical protein KQ657_003139 [Scheffersomyces spartinae]
MSGSFWKFSNGITSFSNILSILDGYNSRDQTLKSDLSDCDSSHPSTSSTLDVLLLLLDENDLLQELLSNNALVLEFLRDEKVLSLLVDLVIHDGHLEETKRLLVQMTDLSIGKDEEKTDEGKTEADTEKVEVDSEKTEGDSEKTDCDKADSDKADSDDSDAEADSDSEETEMIESEEEESDEEMATRRATLAAEILSADVWSLTDTVMISTENLNRLWSILDYKEHLSINLSTYFMKIMEHLLDMKCDEMITYLIENQLSLVEKFMNHLSNPPLMDFLLKLISTDKPDNSTGIIDFLQKQDLITHLINALDTNDHDGLMGDHELTETDDDHLAVDHDDSIIRQSSAADLLKALITISANSTADNSTIGPNELTRELASYDQMKRLCDIMLKGGYALANGVGIIIEIIRKNNSDYDVMPVLYITVDSHPPNGRDPIYLGHLLQVFGDNIDNFNKLLVDEHERGALKTPFGEIEPLGFERFKICELIAELLHCSNMQLLNDTKGFDIVKERDEMRFKMKEYDPISFKYNETITLPEDVVGSPAGGISSNNNLTTTNSGTTTTNNDGFTDDYVNDTIESFNESLHNETYDEDTEESHVNANLTEEQLRVNPVIGDHLKIALYDTQIVSNILEMFFKFQWNNFLHNVVFDIVQQVLNGSMDIGFNKFLAIDLFDSGEITEKIVRGQQLCADYEQTHNGLRLGYMGHLTLIAEEVVKFIQSFPPHSLSELIDRRIESQQWEDYVTDILLDTREKYNAILGGCEEDEDVTNDTTTFDEGVGEILDNSGFKIEFELNEEKVLDHGVHLVRDDDDDEEEEEADDDDEEEQAIENDNNEHNDEDHLLGQDISSPLGLLTSSPAPHNEYLIPDEVKSDDSGSDDEFSNYFSTQVHTKSNAESPLVKSSAGLMDDDSSDDEEEQPMTYNNDNDEDYIDPNDDGLSYKKSNSLYDAQGELLSSFSHQENADDQDFAPEEQPNDADDNADDDDDNNNDIIDAKEDIKQPQIKQATKKNHKKNNNNKKKKT